VTKVAASFVGCKVSQADGEEALADLAAAGLQPVTTRENADVVVVHTCCVTAEAERKSRRLVRRAASAGKSVVVAGCAAALRPEQFKGDGVTVAARPDWAALAEQLTAHAADGRDDGWESVVAGSDAVGGIADDGNDGAIRGATRDASDGVTRDTDDDAVQGPAGREGRDPATGQATGKAGAAAGGTTGGSPDEAPRATPGARTRLVLKVQDGCAGVCTYCVVRLVRGEPRSVPLEEALAAARAGLARGCGEVVLSGIDLGAWRDGGARLPELVAALAGLDGLRRVRLSSVEPRHVTPALLELLAHPHVARHLHVPLQSADDGVLRSMRRPYTFARYLRAVEGLRAAPGGAMLSTDVIVGYPTEDEAAFARTLEALESGLFGRAHVFAYSARPGTAAEALRPLPAGVVRGRMGRALAAAEAAAAAARHAAIGREAEVLVEERRDGLWRGYSSEYVRYSLCGEARRGELVRAVADEVVGDGVSGRVEE
jgi:MiaB/RimO family radical SAM methylthiotransferase